MLSLKTIAILAIFLLAGCTSSKQIEKTPPSIKFYLGGTYGGIIENTDLSLVESTEPDAYTGATRVGGQAGIHYEYPLKHISLETGLDGIINSQTFTYQDDLAGYQGTRDLLVTQIRVPLSINFQLLREKQEDGLIQLKLGLSPGFCFYDMEDKGAFLPTYETVLFNVGPLLGVDFTPWEFDNGSALGISLELFRSFREVYTDYYQLGDMPGLSYLKFGLIYQFKKQASF